jgi:hypothetical protein
MDRLSIGEHKETRSKKKLVDSFQREESLEKVLLEAKAHTGL